MNRAMFTELGDAAEQAAGDDAVRGVLLTAEGPSFSAGIDLSLIGELAPLLASAKTNLAEFITWAQRPFRLLALMDKPTIAAVQGHAIGAGCQLALACDLRVLADDAQLSIREARYALIPDLGGMHHLTRIAGMARAKEIVWSTRSITSEEADRWGLANRVARVDSLTEEATRLAREALAYSPVAVRLTKGLINRTHETPLESEFGHEARAQAVALASDDHREAVAALMEQREPRFIGR
jgi:enoyl-CoA hydratase/carnithine racemase